jgi:menaquinone-dependent protoporphyrinogen oxidase
VRRILVAYASHYGQTRAVAHRIAQRLRENGCAVDVVDGRSPIPSPVRYDAVVLGSRVEMGRHASVVLAYIRHHRGELARMPTAFFSVSMAAAKRDAGDDPSGYLMDTFAELEWCPTESVAFAGALPYRRYDWLTRLVMRRVSRSAGHTTDTSRNHVYTDFAAVDAFARRFVRRLGATEAARV